MKTTITGKNMVVTPGITDRIMKKTNRMERYLKQETEMFVRLSKERSSRRIAEITVPFEGVILRAEASAEDNLYLAIDQALAKLEKQIHRYHTKLEKRLREDAFKNTEMEFIEDATDEAQEDRKVVRTKQFPVRPMSVEDATLQMELLGHAFFVFVNNDTERTNVLYLRKDGNLGLLEPEN